MFLNTTFNNIQLYRDDQFYWWRKPESLGPAYVFRTYRLRQLKISYNWTLFKGLFMQDFDLFKVAFIQV
jgi:hypothetical protein